MSNQEEENQSNNNKTDIIGDEYEQNQEEDFNNNNQYMQNDNENNLIEENKRESTKSLTRSKNNFDESQTSYNIQKKSGNASKHNSAKKHKKSIDSKITNDKLKPLNIQYEDLGNQEEQDINNEILNKKIKTENLIADEHQIKDTQGNEYEISVINQKPSSRKKFDTDLNMEGKFYL